MNVDLLQNAVDYHGKKLFDMILLENNCVPTETKNNDSNVEQTKNRDHKTHLNKDLEEKILKFIAKKSDFLFGEKFFNQKKGYDDYDKDIQIIDTIQKSDCSIENKDEGLPEIEIPPIETFMELPSKCRKEHFFNYAEPGDIVIGYVSYINEIGIHMIMNCFDNQKRRDLTHVKINLICPIQNLPNDSANIMPKLETVYMKNDLIRSVISNIDKANEKCEVSLVWNAKKSSGLSQNVKLGLITEEELPLHYLNIEEYDREPYSFNKRLRRQRGFNNPAYVNMMTKKLKLNTDSRFSLMKELYNFELKKEDMAGELFKQQNKNLALQSVQRGINLFKDDKIQDAILCYNKAISIDIESVEAYVARGALYANDGDYNKAIDDLEQALQLDPDHLNGKKYLKEVFIAQGVKYEKIERYEDSLVYLEKALKIDPGNELIETKIKEINIKINDLYARTRYGPSLPGQYLDNSKHKHSHKKAKSSTRSLRSSSRSSGSRSSSCDSKDSIKIIKSKKSKNSPSSSSKLSRNSSNSKEYRRTSSQPSTSTHTYSNHVKPPSTLSNKKDITKNTALDNNDNDEDLEEFYNNLKKKKLISNNMRK